jgi:hypothetical protein
MPVFETPGNVSLQIKLPSGRVVVTTVDEPRTSVELIPIDRRGSDAVDHISVSADEHQGRHIVRIEQKDRISWGPIQVARAATWRRASSALLEQTSSSRAAPRISTSGRAR